MTAAEEPRPRRVVGRTTATVAGAGAIGPPVAAIIVHLAPSWAPVEWALAALIAWAGGMVSGYLLPPQRPAVVSPSPDAVEPEAAAPEAAPPGAGEPVAVDYVGQDQALPGEHLAIPAAEVEDAEAPR